MKKTYQAVVYKKNIKPKLTISFCAAALTLASYFIFNSLIPFIALLIITLHIIGHIIIKNALTFKATDKTNLIIDDSNITFQTDQKIHWSVKKSDIKNIENNQKGFDLIITLKNNDSVSIAKSCFHASTLLEITDSII